MQDVRSCLGFLRTRTDCMFLQLIFSPFRLNRQAVEDFVSLAQDLVHRPAENK
jgi:hypothetical protein